MADKLTRRQFMRDSAIAGAAIGAGIGLGGGARAADTGKILNYSPDMEYRRCGRTGMMISAVSLGGHWKRPGKINCGNE
nr:twin-arginine translocation signal domain-containing protein [Planctomycetota bacterium]